MDLNTFAEAVGANDPVTVSGMSTRGGAVREIRCVHPPSGIALIEADEMTVRCGAGTPIAELAAALAEVGQRTVLPDGGTVGGALATGWSGTRRLGDGPMRDALLQARYIGADGSIVKAGGPTVKNVSGFDVCRLLVGSRGALGFLGEVILRTRPIAQHSQWFTSEAHNPLALFERLYRPTTVLWNGDRLWVLLEGHPLDVAAAAAEHGLDACDGPPALPSHRSFVPLREQTMVRDRFEPGSFLLEVGVGVVHAAQPGDAGRVDPAVAAVSARVKQQFDPTGRLNPGVVVA